MLKHFLIILVLLIIAGFIFVQVKSAEYQDELVPYIDKNMKSLISWQVERITPLMTKDAKVEFDFEPDSIQAGFNYLSSKVGPFDVYTEAEYMGTRVIYIAGLEFETYITYMVPVYFENGDGDITITLVKRNGSYQIKHLKYYAAQDR